eukprot:356084-Chlamydomonas_euryale.AAC.2
MSWAVVHAATKVDELGRPACSNKGRHWALQSMRHRTSEHASSHFRACVTALQSTRHRTSEHASPHFRAHVTALQSTRHRTSEHASPHFRACVTALQSTRHSTSEHASPHFRARVTALQSTRHSTSEHASPHFSACNAFGGSMHFHQMKHRAGGSPRRPDEHCLQGSFPKAACNSPQQP